jgi:mono/diheme cytochrome c family protein
LTELLAGNWSMVNAPLAKVYDVQAPNATDSDFVRVNLPNRLGILNQGAFLSVFAHASESAPVLRGVAVLRRVTCAGMPSPVDLKRAVVPPAPDPSKTTRARYAEHAQSECAGCHNNIDSFGFAFEGFDGMGMARKQDNGFDVNTAVTVAGTDFDGSFADSNQLVKAMAQSPQVHECFARNIYRAMAGTSNPALRASEDDFVKYWKSGMAEVTESSIAGTLGAYVTSPSFNFRRAQ